MTKQAEPVADFDLDSLAAIDQAELEICSRDGTPTGWKWMIAGPGHPQSIALSDRVTKENFSRHKMQEMARVNGRKWRGEDESADRVLRNAAENLADRVLGWTPVKFNGQEYPFSRENVITLLMDPARGDTLVSQLTEFMSDERSFMKRSVKS
jgi:hypothetical protein